ARVARGPEQSAAAAAAVITHEFVSMRQEKEAASRRKAPAGYQVHEELPRKAHGHAIVLHCLPAHRGDEITAGVIDGPHSAIFDEAENRLHVQKALIEHLILRR